MPITTPNEKRVKQPGKGERDLFAAYLARNPERNPWILVPRSALPLVRGTYLLHGIVIEGWSLGWLVAFLIAEFFLVARLAVLGERIAGGKRKKGSIVVQSVWATLALATTFFAGQTLDRSSRGAWLGFGEDLGVWGWPGLGITCYVALLLADFAAETISARRERRQFVPAAAIQAGFSFAIVLMLSFFVILLSGIADTLFGEEGLRALVATALVLARTAGELAVLWLPYLHPWMEARQRRKRGLELP